MKDLTRTNAKLFKDESKYMLNLVLWGILMIFDLGYNRNIVISTRIGMLMLVIFAYQPTKYKIQSLFFLLPFQVTLIINQQISLLTLFQVITVLTLLVKYKSIEIKNVILLLLFFVLQLVTILLYNASIVEIISLIITLVLIGQLIQHFLKTKSDLFPVLSKSLIFGIVLSSGIALTPYIPTLLNGGSIRRFYGLWNNPNIFSMQLLIGMALTISLLYEKNISVLFGIIILLFFSFLTMMTYSRSSILGLGVLFIFTLIVNWNRETSERQNTKTIKQTLNFALAIIIFYIVFSFTIKPIIEKRGLVSDQKDITSGRITLVKSNLSWIIAQRKEIPLILGYGIENNLNYMKQQGLITSGTHNTYLEMLISSGIVGSLIWWLFLNNSILKKVNIFRKHRQLFLVIVLVYSFTAHLNTSSFVYIVLTLSNIPNNIETVVKEDEL